MPDTGWMDEARCLDADPDIFFPAKGGNTDAAKEVCAGCPVQQECLEYQLAHEQSDRKAYGVWGGMSPRERRRIRRLSKL